MLRRIKMIKRPRRLRKNQAIRNLVRENHLRVEDFICPIFLVEGDGIKEEIETLPDVYHLSVDQLEEEISTLNALDIKQVILFGIPNHKDEVASEAYHPEGIVQQGIRAIKRIDPSMYVITDVCMCQYTDHGHCGILTESGEVENDITLGYLSQVALSHVAAGADMVAPSDMMDGRVGHIRSTLDEHGFYNAAIMAYSAKFASSYYGPFRAAAHSAPSFGDRKAYQMDPANSQESIREVRLDIEEGADIVMVKPALSYLDIIRQIKDDVDVPIAAYNVSGEYAMIMQAIKTGLMHEDVIMETLLSMKRAGANIIITYFSKHAAKILRGDNEQ